MTPPHRAVVKSHDGVRLNGWIWRPRVPDGVEIPVLLVATPYTPRGTKPSFPGSVGGIPGEDFVAKGYAVALFSVRGTGDSGGCFGFKSGDEQKDQVDVVDWLGQREWSNGRVAMVGLSYAGTTPVMAAIQNPPALKTIVIAGTILDEYGFLHTPQGAQFFEGSGVGPVYAVQQSLYPGPSPANWSPEGVATTRDRICRKVIEVNTVVPEGEIKGRRNPRYWKERRFIDRVPGITAATWVVHGFQDRYGSGHAFQDDWAWESLDSAPKRMIVGQWHHQWPTSNSIHPDWVIAGWFQRLLGWFDYWLKGKGRSAPGLGTVEFQDDTGAWHETGAWPPPSAHDEVVYLSHGSVTSRALNENRSFRSITPLYRGATDPNFVTNRHGWRWTTPCSDPTRLAYVSKPVKKKTTIAGNPFVWLDLESSAPGGLIEVQLYDVRRDFSCTDPRPYRARPLNECAADLSYHSSEDYRARNFPVDRPKHVRVDLPNLAEVLKPGHRLAVVLSHGVYYRWTSREYFPTLTVHGRRGDLGSSQLVLPILTGGFGGKRPTLSYPPRPFLPRS